MASNYCRNPSKEPTGVWCYTGDLAETDLCDVPSCVTDDSAALIVNTNADKKIHWVYVLPEWRVSGIKVRLKYWIPLIYEGITIYFKSQNDSLGYCGLEIGAEKNEKLQFFRVDKFGNRISSEDQVYPHLLMANCLTHIVESKEFSVYLPIRFQSNVGLSRIENKIDFYFRHNGTTRLALIQQQLNKGYLIEIKNRVIALLWRSMDKKPKLLESNTFNVNIIKEHSWSHIGLSWDENTLWINCSEGLQMWTLSGKSAPLLVRYFSVANRGGQTTWTVNCNPPDIDGTPRNGGWSDWGEWEQCSKTCGTGMGIRYRQCDNPKPNMFGEPCVGPTEFPGKCNEHECGQLSKKTIKNIQDRIRQKTYNLHAVEGEKLILVCNKNSVNAVKVDLVNPTFDWIKNGKLLEKGGKNVKNDGCKLVIHKCTKSDSGVYAYIVQPLDRQKVILKIIAVTIMESPTYAYIGDIIQIVIEGQPTNQIIISYFENSTDGEFEIFHKLFDKEELVSYWQWHHYSITIIDKSLQVQKLNINNKMITLLKITDFKIQFLHWFGIGTKNVGHWTLYCSGPENYPLPQAELPECTISLSGYQYSGSQWITENGEQCLPWNITELRKKVDEKLLIDGNYVAANNYCRNPTKDPKGPYCFIDTNGTVTQRQCLIRSCRNMRSDLICRESS
ncbi:uncharacterized protein LOC126902018 [Daktulosphaira vitifoliae]|uniref:uncharacterized protein LOC126902018 n=1 Tax=Daktulosphaira vitifoliae TaxID=58002 RepID=UPI0021AAB685|nr:uncharacterized protein LOC126902018 [Daktulosphaira vitifoliae]